MKKVLVATLVVMQIVLPCIAYGQTPQQVDYMKLEMKAERDAEADVKVSKAGWGIGAFLASVLFSPLIGGGATIVAAYTIGGSVEAPAAKMGEVEQMYPGNYMALKAYEDQYKETYASIKKKRQAKAAWYGTGVGFALNFILIVSAEGY